MIRMVIVCDRDRVLGGANPKHNPEAQERQPAVLRQVLDLLHGESGPAVASPPNLWWFNQPNFALRTRICYSRKDDVVVCGHVPEMVTVHDAASLAANYRSQGDLLILGGARAFRDFLPFADRLSVVETKIPQPDGAIFDHWDNHDFMVVSDDRWEGGRTLHLVRRAY